MKRILLLILILLQVTAFAQDKKPGDFQVGLFGGGSAPLGDYKTIGETKTGYFGGIFFDKYFKGNYFGLGFDARYIQHGIDTYDSLKFKNGFLATDYQNHQNFNHLAFTFGPSFKQTFNKFHVEIYVKGGVLMQNFPAYQTKFEFTDAVSKVHTHTVKQTLNGTNNKANAWLGLGGLRFNYQFNKHLAVFAMVDYMQTFGSSFGKKNSKFIVEEYPKTNKVLDPNSTVNSFLEYYEEVPVQKSTNYQSVNVAVGLKYILGKNKLQVKEEPKKVETYDAKVAEKKAMPKEIQIVVKDKQTGLALSGVTVAIKASNDEFKSVSNANGEAERVKAAQPGVYEISGDKNGIKTSSITISLADFNTGAPVIFKEIFHDDPRFTLIGETIDCEQGTNVANIPAILTNSTSQSNTRQTSDQTGKFIFQLEQQADYTVVANQAGKYSQTELVTTKGLDRSKTLYVTLKLGVCELKKGNNWVLKNIFYDFDKSNIRLDASTILNNVVSILNQNPTLKIELSSHTDSRGNDLYNMKLSQARAQSAVNYLISKGIDKNRLVAKGYGETKLVNQCSNGVDCSEQEHQENRRTEIKILNY